MGDLIFRLRKRAEIRRNATSRKSVQEGSPDRISDLLEEAANEIEDIKINIKLFLEYDDKWFQAHMNRDYDNESVWGKVAQGYRKKLDEIIGEDNGLCTK